MRAERPYGASASRAASRLPADSVSAINVGLADPADGPAFARDVAARVPTIAARSSRTTGGGNPFVVLGRFHTAIAILTVATSAVFLLALQNEGAVAASLRDRLFRHFRLAPMLTGEQEERYRAASRLAERYCGWLDRRFLRRSRLDDLARESRRFYRLGQRQKLERIAGIQ